MHNFDGNLNVPVFGGFRKDGPSQSIHPAFNGFPIQIQTYERDRRQIEHVVQDEKRENKTA